MRQQVMNISSNISFVTKSDDQFTWADKDFAVAEAQFELDFAGTDAVEAVRHFQTGRYQDILKKPMVMQSSRR